MEALTEKLFELQSLSPGVPLYIFIEGIHPVSWVQVEKNLEEAPAAEEIDVILNSSGGLPNDAYKIIRAFRAKYEVVNIIVPFWAKSAATLMSFGATRLVLHDRAELGPIDAQIRKDDETSPDGSEVSSALIVQSSIAQIEKRSREGILEMFTRLRSSVTSDGSENEIVKIGRRQLAKMLFEYSANFYAPLLEKIDPSEMGQRARDLDIGRMYARRILTQFTDTEESKIDELLYFLVYECPDHGYVVDYQLLSSFLPFVIRSDEEPFGQKYHKVLGEVAIALFDGNWPKINDFILELLPKNERTAIIKKEDGEQSEEQSNEQNSETRESSSGSDGNADKKILAG